MDTSVWLDHLNAGVPALQQMLLNDEVVIHRYVIGEIAMGNWKRRTETLVEIEKMRQVFPATHDEVMHLVEKAKLYGIGIGYVDAHLLATVRMTEGCKFWTRDKRLRAAATDLGVASPLI